MEKLVGGGFFRRHARTTGRSNFGGKAYETKPSGTVFVKT